MNLLDQAEALIKHWLNEDPADSDDDYVKQISQSLWLEERQLRFLAQIWGAKIK